MQLYQAELQQVATFYKRNLKQLTQSSISMSFICTGIKTAPTSLNLLQRNQFNFMFYGLHKH